MKKNLFTLLGCFVILLISFNSSKAQYYQINEGFESVSFPPAGWTTKNLSGAKVWARNTSKFHSGAASAFIRLRSQWWQ